MAVTIAHAELIWLDPQPPPIPKVPHVEGNSAVFQASLIGAKGTVALQAGATESVAGWEVGFIQVELIETNWAHYVGRTQRQGSIFVQRARPPARPRQSYRDTMDYSRDAFYGLPNLAKNALAAYGIPDLGADVFVETAPKGTVGPFQFQVVHYDKPGDTWDTTRLNGTTHEVNFLREAQLEFAFCAILSAREPTGTYHHLKHFYWNVRWQATFAPDNMTPGSQPQWRVTPVGAGMAGGVDRIKDGAPNDPRLTSILTSPQARNANAAAGAETDHPIVRESTRWETFDVTR